MFVLVKVGSKMFVLFFLYTAASVEAAEAAVEAVESAGRHSPDGCSPETSNDDGISADTSDIKAEVLVIEPPVDVSVVRCLTLILYSCQLFKYE